MASEHWTNKRNKPGSSSSDSENSDSSTPSKIARTAATDSDSSQSSDMSFVVMPNSSLQDQIFWNAVAENDVQTVEEMLDNGYDVNQRNEVGYTPLITAVEYEKLDVVKSLLSRGANPNLQTKNGVTALHIAAGAGALDIVYALIASSICEIEIRDPNKKGNTPLLWATQKNHVEVVQVLLEAGANPEARNTDDDTAFMLALPRQHLEIVKILIEHDIANEEKRALFLATLEGRSDDVRDILAGGCSPEITFQGWTPLFLAVLSGKTEVVRVLIKAGCNINANDSMGHNALWWAAKQGSLYLTPQTAPKYLLPESYWRHTIKELIESSCEITGQYSEPQYQYLLRVAIKERMTDLVGELMFHNFQRDFKMETTGETPLLKALAQGCAKSIDFLLGVTQSYDASRQPIPSSWGLEVTYKRLFDSRKNVRGLHYLDSVINQIFARGCFFQEIDPKGFTNTYHFFIGQRVHNASLPMPVGYRSDGTCYISDLREGCQEAFEELSEHSQEVLNVWFFTMPRFLRREIEPQFRQYQAAKQLEASQPSSSSSSGSSFSAARCLSRTLLPPPRTTARTSTERNTVPVPRR
jgi:ankyrin repeat protein